MSSSVSCEVARRIDRLTDRLWAVQRRLQRIVRAKEEELARIKTDLAQAPTREKWKQIFRADDELWKARRLLAFTGRAIFAMTFLLPGSELVRIACMQSRDWRFSRCEIVWTASSSANWRRAP